MIKNLGNKNKNKQMGPNETSKLFHSKGNHKRDKKTTLRMGENICKQINGQRKKQTTKMKMKW